MNDDIEFPSYDPRDRTVIAFATIDARDFEADDNLVLQVRAAQTAGSGPVIEIGRYEIPVAQLPALLRAIGRMAALFDPTKEVTA